MATFFFLAAIVSGIVGAAYIADGDRTGRVELSRTGAVLICLASACLVFALLLTIAGVLANNGG
jgi:threonine/homoserine efflux transporter RhtA